MLQFFGVRPTVQEQNKAREEGFPPQYCPGKWHKKYGELNPTKAEYAEWQEMQGYLLQIKLEVIFKCEYLSYFIITHDDSQ